MERWASSGVRASAWRTEEQARMPRRASPESGRMAFRRAEKERHVLGHLVSVGVGKSGGVLAELARHAGHYGFRHALFTCALKAFRNEIPNADEGNGGVFRQKVFASAAVRPPVQNTAFLKPESRVERTQMRMVAM